MSIASSDTIIAQCTPQGSGAIALLRLSGHHAVVIADKCARLASGKKLIDVATHTIHYGSVVQCSTGKSLDNVLFFLMRAPKTFTGEDVVEISCHNNPFLIEQIVQEAVAQGARLAQNGEFSQRAFLNGKLDLMQAEAIHELVVANSEQGLRRALEQLDGSFSHWIKQLERDLILCLAHAEASFEFLDDPVGFASVIEKKIEQIQQEIARAKISFDQQKQIRQGVRIAIIGSVNAGKSSLFNALLQQNRAIVAPVAGTTRDTIETGMYRNGIYWTLVDTAGLRQTGDLIEQEGIKRSHDEAHKADIIILVYDGSTKMRDAERGVYQELLNKHADAIIIVRNKCDLPVIETAMDEHVVLSACLRHNCDTLFKLLDTKIASIFEQCTSPFLLNKRHYTILIQIEGMLHSIVTMLQETEPPYELIAEHFKDVLQQLTEFTGKTISQQGMDAVFRSFCVGK